MNTPEAEPGVVTVVEVLAFLKSQILFLVTSTDVLAIAIPATLVPVVVVLDNSRLLMLFCEITEVPPVVELVCKIPIPAKPAVAVVTFKDVEVMFRMVFPVTV